MHQQRVSEMEQWMLVGMLRLKSPWSSLLLKVQKVRIGLERDVAAAGCCLEYRPLIIYRDLLFC